VAASHIKGACLVEALQWMERNAGHERVAAALARMSVEARGQIDVARPSFGILASQWYPAENTHVVLDAMTADLSALEREQMARGIAKAVMAGTLHGVYGVLFRMMATPERYAQHAHKLWSKYYDSGRVRFSLPEPHRMVAVISDWGGHHPFLCAIVRFARVAALEAMGCREVISAWRCKSGQGGDECVTEVRWA
jgi:hypothetical protein